MVGLTGLAWRSLWARRLRATLTGVGIGLGVAVLVASFATSAAIDASIDRTVREIVGKSDLRVAAFQERGLGDETLAAIRSTPGVGVAAPGLERRTYLGASLVGPGDALPAPVTVLGIDPALEPSVRDLTLRSGAPLARPDEPSALISERLATEDRLGLGSELTIQGAGEPARYRVVGILAGDGPVIGSGGRTVVVPLLTAQAVFDVDRVTRVDVVLAEGADAAAVTRAFADRLLTEPYVLSSPTDLATSLRATTIDFQAMTALIAAVALFGGALLIFNTLSMTVAERIREIALLRAAGATRSQVIRFVLAGALLLGAIGSLAGLWLGAALVIGIVAWVGEIGSVVVEEPVLPLAGVIVAALVGIVVTVVAAIEPARRAAGIPPIEALRPRPDLLDVRRARLRWVVAVFTAVAVVGFLAWPRGAGEAGLVRALAVYGLLLAVTLVSPVLLPTLVRLARIPFGLVAELETRLAANGFVRDRSRATLTVGALTIGLAMVVALGGVGQNARLAASAWLVDVVPGDLVLTSIREVGLDEGIDEILAGLPGVERISPIASFEVALDGVRTDAVAVVGADLGADGRLRFVEGDRDASLAALDAGGAAILPVSLADRLGIGVGETLDAPAGDGSTVALRVVAIVERSFPGRAGEAILVGWDDAIARLGALGADAFAVRFAADASADDRTAFAREARAFALEPVTLDQIEGAVDDALGRVFGLFDALAVVAVIVAALGIVNALSMNVVERIREIGVLRALGMTRRRVWRMVVVEAGIVGLVGAVLGILTGIAAGAVMIVTAGGELDPRAFVPWTSVAIALVLGVVLAMLSAAWPAHVAAQIPIVQAVRHE